MSDNRTPLRIGNDERSAAIKALDEHLVAGRIDHEEYGERMASATMAKTRAELETLFDDLPAPHPFASTPVAGPPQWGQWGPPSRTYYDRPVRRSGAQRTASVAVVGAVLLTLAPFIAMALFFFTGVWVVFLLIPALGMLFGHRGPRGSRSRGCWGARR